MRRLSNVEYDNTIRDLFYGLPVSPSAEFPADEVSLGFDNIADVQMPSATVMQGYMRAAAYVSRVAVGDPSVDPSSTQYEVPRTLSQKERLEGAPRYRAGEEPAFDRTYGEQVYGYYGSTYPI
mgnify:CR=1 FL=1